MMQNKTKYSALLEILEKRFAENMHRHHRVLWGDVEKRIVSVTGALFTLQQMEETGGEPDVISYNAKTGEVVFCDFSKESPLGRRNLCYDMEALQSRKTAKPKGSAVQMAEEMGVQLLDEKWYRKLQTLGDFDTKTSSWILTPSEVRGRGGAEFSDKRYGKVYVYHNGAESYYASRGFRALLFVA